MTDIPAEDFDVGTDDTSRICEFDSRNQSLESFFEFLQRCVLSKRLVFHPHDNSSPVRLDLLNAKSRLREILKSGFHRVVVLDTQTAFDAHGRFSLNTFYGHAFRECAQSFGIADVEAYHEEDLVQTLRDEPKSLICLVNVHLLSSEHRKRLRSLTQEHHHSLILYEAKSATRYRGPGSLQVLKGMTPGQIFKFDNDRMILGRHPECDIVLDVGAVSRQHAVVLRQHNEFFVEDLKSRNGTFVNGEVVVGLQKLQENDRIKIGDVILAFHESFPVGGRELSPPVLDFDDSGSFCDSDDSGFSFGSSSELKLQALIEITRNLACVIDLNIVLGKVIDSLFKIFIQADRGFVVLTDPATGTLVPRAVKYRRGDDAESIRISRTIVNQVMSSCEAILSADAANDPRFDGSQSIADFRIRSMMCAPLMDFSGKALGVIQIDTLDQRSRFQAGDLELLASVAYQAAFAIENAQLHANALRQQALERDLALAEKVQQGFLPDSPPQIPFYEFFDYYKPANQIGGDYFDYVPLQEGKLAVVIGDVASKGMPAALLIARLSADVRYSLASVTSPVEACERLPGRFFRGALEDRFVTLILLFLDPKKHEATLVNAGHMSPYLRHADGRLDMLGEREKGLPLGVVPDTSFESVTVALAPGDSILLFTDGINEAMNADNALYGLERVEAVLKKPGKGCTTLGKGILDDVNDFVGKRAQSDDKCLICFGRA